MKTQIAIAGAGPAGLATALHAARRGFDVIVVDRREGVLDKPCGEGLMPRGLRELQALGISVEGMPFRGIRYVSESGASVEGLFRDGAGLGVRRTELSRALNAALRVRRVHATVRGVEPGALLTDTGRISADLIVGADGLASPVRHAAGLDGKPASVRRFGARTHVVQAPPEFVEVRWSDGCETYLTPVGPQLVNVAMLWEPSRVKLPRDFHEGAGPLARNVVSPVSDRLALVGDAAGYVDAITGQGLSLAFLSARLLVESLPADLRDTRTALAAYARALRGHYLAYARPASALLWLARHTALRRAAFRALTPRLFSRLLGVVG